MTKKRVWRVFDATFKIEAVRRMGERKARHVPMGEIARDLGVPSDLLRRWARQLREHAGQAPTEFPVRLMCRVVEVSVSGFYAACGRPMSARTREDERLLVCVRASFQKHRRRYGSPRVHRHLQHTGTHVSSKRVARLMRADGLVARPKTRFIVTTTSAHGQPVAANTLARDFAIAPARAVNTTWVSDITYLPTDAGWVYLAIVLDLASRRVVGWARSTTLETALRRPIEFTQYASQEYHACLMAHGGTVSMSRRGNC